MELIKELWLLLARDPCTVTLPVGLMGQASSSLTEPYNSTFFLSILSWA